MCWRALNLARFYNRVEPRSNVLKQWWRRLNSISRETAAARNDADHG
jgi:hypothetical protein